MKALAVLIWMSLPAVATAQAYVPPPSVDPATIPSKSDVQAANTAAASAQAAATAAATSAATAQAIATAAQTAAATACKALPAIPPAELVGGTTGTANTSCRPADATQPRITRAGRATTDSGGNWSVTWVLAFAAAPVTLPIPMNTGGEPIVCNVATSTATGASGRCWLARTLPATITLLSGLISYDVLGGSASGTVVQVFAIPVTQ